MLHVIAGLSGGGSERWLRDVIALSPAGLSHRVVTLAPDAGPDPVYADDLAQLDAYQRHRLPAPIPALLGQIRRHWPARSNGLRTVALGAVVTAALPRLVLAVRQFRPDVIHSHTTPDFLLGLAVARIFHTPLVHTVPCLFSQLMDTGHFWVPRLYGTFHPWVACFSTGEGWRQLEQIHVPRAKILYDLGGVDLLKVDAVLADRQRHASQVRRDLGMAPHCPLALSVGRLHPSKGHMLALESLPALLELVPDLHWAVLGEGEQRQALEEKAACLGVQHRTHLVGYLREPLRFHAAADVYFRTPLLEPENFSFYEAMAMGLPALGFATGEPRDLLLEVGHGVQLAAGEVTAFARAAAVLLQLPDRGRSLGALGAAYARQNLDVRSSVTRLSSVYLDLSRGHCSNPPHEFHRAEQPFGRGTPRRRTAPT